MLTAFLALPIAASMRPAWFDGVTKTAPAPVLAQVPGATVATVAMAAAGGTPSVGPDAHPPATARRASFSSGAASALALDRSWNPGPIASAHQPWAQDCKLCHAKPFERVRDTECLSCHRDVGDHVDARTVALPAVQQQRCASCHRDHQGAFGLAEQNRHFTGTACAACHADIKHSSARTDTVDVTDFASGHPAFRVQLAILEPARSDRSALSDAGDTAAPRKPGLARVRQAVGVKMTEQTSLKFPHDVHMARAGISGPNGKVTMACDTCHKVNPDGVRFRAVTMKDDCQSCHALKFEAALSNREVPHGPVADVLSTLREFYGYAGMSRIRLDVPQQPRPIFFLRPGQQENTASFVKGPGDARSRAAASATELFEKTGCVVCHEVSRVAGPGRTGTPGQDLPQWKIAPVVSQHAWMPKAEFSHARHRASACTDCHAGDTSKHASDVLMPQIQVCRDCHAGKVAQPEKVVSDCALCHGFHLPAHGTGSAVTKSRATRISGAP